MPTINMLSSANKVKGQGVSSAYIEQVKVVVKGLSDKYNVINNSFKLCDIMHYHTIDFKHYLTVPFARMFGVNVGYVHFLPETVDTSIELPAFAKRNFYKYIISFYKSMDHLVIVNPHFTKELVKYGIDQNKITYIPNFVSQEQFFPYDEASKLETRRKYGIEKDTFVVLGVGQVQTRKGIVEFIEVARNFPDIQFIWAGGFSFGVITAGYKELKKIVENPPHNIKFLGIVDRDEMNDIYNISNLMFLPSYQELFPMTVLESFNCKTPILLRDIDIYNDVFFDFYLKGSNVNEFNNIIGKLQSSPEYYKYWSNQSWKGHEFYSEEHILGIWKDFYDRVYNMRILRNDRRKIRDKKTI